MTSHCFKWSPLPPNEVGRFEQHVRERDGRKEGKDGGGRGANEMMYCLSCLIVDWTIYVRDLIEVESRIIN